MTVAQLRTDMTQREFTEWYAFHRYKEHRAKSKKGG